MAPLEFVSIALIKQTTAELNVCVSHNYSQLIRLRLDSVSLQHICRLS